MITMFLVLFAILQLIPLTSGSQANINGAVFYHVGAVCGVGLPCPPYVANRPITCVECYLFSNLKITNIESMMIVR